jgi:hypothetical protein
MNPAQTTAHTQRRFRRALPVLAACFGAVALAGAAGCSNDTTRTVTVTHGPAAAPTVVDLGTEGPSAGDQRIFHFDAQSNGTVVQLDWIMTTIAIDSPEPGVETRMNSAVFSFGGLADTLLLQGTGWYPGEAATFKVSATLDRAIVGGTGKYRGATGWVESTHNADGTWTHVFHLT